MIHTLQAPLFYNCLCWENNKSAEQLVEYKFEKIVSVVKIVKFWFKL